MPQLRELLIEQLQDLLFAETQLTNALPKMAEAAHHPTVKAAIQKHLIQTEEQVERLNKAFDLLGGLPSPRECRGIAGLLEEGEEVMQKGAEKDPLAADLCLIAAAQKVEHYEISSYGTARSLARQIGEYDCARLLSHTLGEEESADFLLTMIADPLVQQATLDELGAATSLDKTEKRPSSQAKRTASREKVAS